LRTASGGNLQPLAATSGRNPNLSRAARIDRLRAGRAHDRDGRGIKERGRADLLANAEHESRSPGGNHQGNHRDCFRRGGALKAKEKLRSKTDLFCFFPFAFVMASQHHRLSRYGPLVLWAALIFIASTSLLSGSNTSTILRPAVLLLFPNTTEATLNLVQFFVRKAGHL